MKDKLGNNAKKRAYLLVLPCFLAFLIISAFTPAKTAENHGRVLPDTNQRNVVYGSNIMADGKTTQTLTMDIYYPPNIMAGKKYPMVMMIHGGTFLNGSKENMSAICKQMADSGFVAVTINYRKGWNVASAMGGCQTIDVNSLTMANYRAIQDGHAAMRFLVENAAKYHIDTKWLFIGGASAGGIMALNITYLNQKTADEKFGAIVSSLGKLDNVSNTSTQKFKIKGVCNMWGALSDSTLISSKNAVPTIFYHGTGDKTVPYDRGYYIPGCTRLPELYGSACLYRQTIAAGQVGVMNTSIGGKHGPVEFTASLIASNTACFFHKVMLRKAKSVSYTDAVAGCR